MASVHSEFLDPPTTFTINHKEDGNHRNNFKKNLQSYFRQYCSVTGIHGMLYLGEAHRKIIERIWWLIWLAISLYFCVVFILETYEKWENSPVIVSFATRETPIWKIPFPAVTICPEVKSRPGIFNYTKYLYRKQDGIHLNEDEEEKLSYLSLVCSQCKGLKFNTSNFIENDKFFDFLEEAAPNFLQDISECFFMGDQYDCADFFTPIITDEGLCYTFNLLNREDLLKSDVVHYKNYHRLGVAKSPPDWSLENGYNSNASRVTYPRRALYAGALFDMGLKLRTHSSDLDFTCGNSIQGFKIQIHHPSMLPRVKQQHFRIPLDQAVIAAIMPNIMTTSKAVRSYAAEKRECFFPSERNLKYFQVYTQLNCQIECKTNYTLRQCGCVDFYMPKESGDKLCGAPLKSCMEQAENDLLTEKIDYVLNESHGVMNSNITELHELVNDCNCMPECNSMTYIVENSQSDWDWVSKYKFDRNSQKFNKSTTHMSYLQVFFKGNQFITSERNELYGPTDFFANFGGLLGLFTGFSALSVIEIIYFLTLRIYCNIKMYGSHYWAGHEE